MPTPVEMQPWFPRWKESIERVIAAREARDQEQPGSPAWEAADTEYWIALAAHRVVASQIR
jgi:hypothetical protein